MYYDLLCTGHIHFNCFLNWTFTEAFVCGNDSHLSAVEAESWGTSFTRALWLVGGGADFKPRSPWLGLMPCLLCSVRLPSTALPQSPQSWGSGLRTLHPIAASVKWGLLWGQWSDQCLSPGCLDFRQTVAVSLFCLSFMLSFSCFFLFCWPTSTHLPFLWFSWISFIHTKFFLSCKTTGESQLLPPHLPLSFLFWNLVFKFIEYFYYKINTWRKLRKV